MAGYVRDWERLSDALKRVVETGVSEDDAKRALCNAIADRRIKVRIYFMVSPKTLEWLSRRELSRSEVREVKPDEIPPRLKSDDFDWSQSRVRKPWPKVRSPAGSFLGHWLPIERSHHSPNDLSPQSLTSPRRQHPSYWHRVELFRHDVTKVLITDEARASRREVSRAEESYRPHNGLSVGKSSRKRRRTPKLENVQRAIKELYPNGVPDQLMLPNALLCQQVSEKLNEIAKSKQMKPLSISDDTILRAAGRRR
jgi:hypothetical protein